MSPATPGPMQENLTRSAAAVAVADARRQTPPRAVYHLRRMKVDVRHFDDVIVVDLNGRLVSGDGADILGEIVAALLEERWTKILLNFEKITTIDSTGAGELVESLKNARAAEASLKLLRPRERVAKSLQIGQLLPLFEVFADEAEAVKSF
jgi:anti-sigma B factor antagonist